MGSFTSSLTGLTANTKYYVRAYATNETGTAYGSENNFTTSPIALPQVTTSGVTAIFTSSSLIIGEIVDDGGSPIMERGVCWATSDNPSLEDNKTISEEETVSFSCFLDDLVANTTYYVRAYAINSAGTSYGDVLIFTTSSGIPQIITLTPSEITAESVVSGGNITSDGGSPVISRGIQISHFETFPVFESISTSDGTGVGIFNSKSKGLSSNTTYYLRAYATNSIGTNYGEMLIFKTAKYGIDIVFNPNLTYGTIADIDGNNYKTIQIAYQTWFAENLRTSKFNDGISIPYVTDSNVWVSLNSSGFCWLENDINYKNFAGALYNWYAVNTGKLCPSGWHLPNLSELDVLETFLGEQNAGGKLKETGTAYWLQPNEGATNESGFSAISSGYYPGISSIHDGGAIWWTSEPWWSITEPPIANAWMVTWNSPKMEVWSAPYTYGYAVRCIKDN